MEILQLKYFCDAAESENFSKTAEKFFVPPSSVSQSIRRLENELGTSLFDRRANRISLNEEGKIFYRAVSQSDRILTDAKRELTDCQKELHGEVRLQILCNRRIVSEAIGLFNHQFPKVTFVLNHGYVSKQEFDLIISDRDFFHGSFVGTPLVTEEIGLACSCHHPLAKHESISVADLSQERFITPHENNSLSKMTHHICNEAGFAPHIAIECDDPLYIRTYIEMGLGIGFVPLFSFKGQLSDKLVIKKIPDLVRTTNVYHNPKIHMTKAVQKFLEILTELCARS